MERPILTIDARMLFSSGVGTYLRNLLKRLRFEELGLAVTFYVANTEAMTWLRQYQPNAVIKICPEAVYTWREQFFWLRNLRGGAFWSPNFNIPWSGYEKLLVTVHDCFALTPLTHPLMRLYGNIIFRRIRQQADAILTVSEFSKRELESQAKIFDTPITVIHNGVEPNWFTTALPAKPYPFNYFVYVGSLKPHKNLYRLLKAYKKISPEQKLVCVGSFGNNRFLDNKALRLLKRMPNVITTQYVDGERLRTIVKHAEGLILPSLYEGFGLPPLEAMAGRVPALVSNTSSLPEICGANALYFNPYTVDSIAKGLEKLVALEGAERANLIERGSEHASHFNWDKTAQETYEVFKATLL